MKNIIILILMVSFNSYAFNWHPHSNKGILITPEFVPSNQVALKSGETTTLKGDICAVSWGHLFNTKEKCQKLIGSVQVKAYFPDMTTDVTEQINLVKNPNRKGYKYSYTTSQLKPGDKNTLTIVVGPTKSRVDKLLKVQAKFQKRLQFIESRLQHHKDKKSHKNWSLGLDFLKTKIEKISSNITTILENNPEILSQINIPLQVDNDYASPFYYSSMFGGYKLSIQTELGSPIEGETTTLITNVKNLSHLSFWFPEIDGGGSLTSGDEEGGNHYSFDTYFRGQKIFSSDYDRVEFGKSLVGEFILENLKADDANSIELFLFKETKSRVFKNFSYKRKVGVLKYDLQVAEDNTVPKTTFSPNDSSFKYYQDFPIISGSVANEFGRIDPESVYLKAVYTSLNEEVSELDFSSIVQIDKNNQGQSYNFSANINSLSEGVYKLEFRAADFASNASVSNPVVNEFRIDRTKPIINFATFDNQLTNNPTFRISALVEDHSPVMTEIVLNGSRIISTPLNTIEENITLIEGINTVELRSVDMAGNISSKELTNIKLDTTPALLGFVTPQGGMFSNSKSIQISGNSNEALKSIIINDELANLSFDKLSFNLNITANEQGTFNIEVKGKDLAGNDSIISRSITIDTLSPTISLIGVQQSLTNQENYAFEYSVTDATALTNKVFLNDSLVNSPSENSGNLNLTLAQGENIIKFESTDAAGNKSSKVLSGIKLDSTPSVITLSTPLDGIYQKETTVLVKGASNEVLKSVNINGNQAVLSEDKLSFEISLKNTPAGEFEISVLANDLAENETTYSRKITIDNVLPELLNFLPESSPILSSSDFSISGDLKDTLGKIDIGSAIFEISGKKASGDDYSVNIYSTLNFQKNDEGASYSFTGQILGLDEGNYTLTVDFQDLAQNKVLEKFSREIVIDKTAPVITITPYETRQNKTSFLLAGDVSDLQNVSTEIFVNNIKVKTVEGKSLQESIELQEGYNLVALISKDSVGNVSDIFTLDSIFVDSIAPELTSVTPDTGAVIVGTTKFLISGTSNEKLSKVLINDVEASLTSETGFSNELSTFTQGDYTYKVALFDEMGNLSEYSKTIELIFTVLNKNLITIEPIGNGDELRVIGAKGAARPNIEVKASAGFFNSEYTTSNSDGSFEIILDYFSSVTLSAEDPSVDTKTTFTLTFNADTTLIGQVKDNKGIVLPGVIVKILDSDQSATTDVNGTYQIANPKFGDQKILIDPSGIPSEVLGEGKEFFNTAVTYSIGRTQRNLMPTIYLSPLILDGSETEIVENTSARVTSPHAPGIELNIPADTTIFPSGQKVGKISMSLVEADKLTLPTPDFASPSHVINFEPSGTTFEEPVEVILPNENNFPPLTDVVLLSKNSATGQWEVDGVAEVSENGNEIRTKEGMGLTHFSDIFAVPILPRLTQFKSGDSPGVSLTENALRREITLPSYKSLNQDIAPKLIYKSTWANPKVIVKHSFDYPYEKITRTENSKYKTQGFDINENNFFESWTGPSSVDFKFKIGNKESEAGKFVGVPYRTVVSYAFDLAEFDSGIYPYLANFEIHFNNLTLRTRTISGQKVETSKYFFGLLKKKFVTNLIPFTENLTESTLIGQVIPQDLLGPVYLQNKINSDFGKGWMFGGIPSIVNTVGPRVMLEEGNGNLKTYNLDNKILTLYEDADGISSSSLQDLPSIVYSDGNGKIKKVSSFDDTPSEIGTLPEYTGTYRFYAPGTIFNGQPANCYFVNYSMKVKGNAASFFPLGGDEYLATDTLNGVVKIDNSGTNYISGGKGRTPNRQSSELFGYFFRDNGEFNVTSGGSSKCSGENATGTIPMTGNKNDSLVDSEFSAPRGIAQLNANEYLVADTGNGLIRKLNLTTNIVTTFAGRGANRDDGDGGLAINAGIFKPKAITVAPSGNVYFSSEKGLIRKIDTAGNISHVAGKSIADGGEFLDSTTIDKVNFDSPTGLAFNEITNELFVADTGHNRIVRISFNENRADIVAGNGSCASSTKTEENALAAKLCLPTEIFLDSDENLVVLDSGNNKIKKLILNSTLGTANTFISSKPDGSVLKRKADQTWERLLRSGDKLLFSIEGKITSAITRDGKTTNYSYEGGKLKRITDPTGSETSISYTGDGKLESITDPVGRITSFVIDSENELTDVSFPDSTSHNYTYEDGLLKEEFNKNGNKRTFTYNNYSRLIKVTDPDGSFKEFYNEEDRTLANEYTDLSEDPGKLQGYGDEEEELSMNIFDDNGNHYKIVPGENGLAQTITNPDGTQNKFEYDEDNRLKKKINSDDSYVEYSYNEFNDILNVYFSASDSTISSEFNSFGQILKQTDALGSSTEYTYEATKGHLLKVKNHLGHEVDFTYNPFGQVLTTIDHLDNVESIEYDTYGNIAKTISHNDDTVSLIRDDAGNILTQTDPNNKVTTYSFDTWNRLLAVTDPSSEVFTYNYDNMGNLLSQAHPSHGATSFEYDEMERVVKTTTSTGQVYESAYDGNDNLKELKDALGNITQLEYDSRNRLTKKTTEDDVYTLEYDIDNNLISTSNNYSEISMDYERVNGAFVLKETTSKGKGAVSDYPSNSVINTFDLNGNRTNISNYVGNFSYNYNELDLLTSITNHKSETVSFSYDSAQRLVGIESLGLETLYDFDGSGHLSRIEHRKGSSLLNFFDYERDSVGNRTKITSNAGVANHTYDNQNMLLTSSNPEAVAPFNNESFSYDALSNRTSDQNRAYTYDSKGRKLLEDTNFSYEYNLNGSVTKKLSKSDNTNFITFTYNSENKLILIEKFESSVKKYSEEYFYDALQRRIKTVATEGATVKQSKFLYDGDEVIAELDQDNDPIFVYTNSTLNTDDVLSIEATNKAVTRGLASVAGSFSIAKDALGSVIDIRDTAGNLVQHYVYSAFGKLLDIKDNSSASIKETPKLKQPYMFANREYSQSLDLYYNRARTYDPEIGRFLQEDSFSGLGNVPSTVFNKYIYGLNNPLSYTDPSGEFVCGGFCVGAIAVAFTYIGSEFSAYYSDDRPRDDSFFYVGVNLNTDGGFDGFAVGGGSGNASVYYNIGEGYAEWIFALQSDSRGINSVYPALSVVGAGALFKGVRVLGPGGSRILGVTGGILGKKPARLDFHGFRGSGYRANGTRQPVLHYHTPWNNNIHRPIDPFILPGYED